MINIIVAASLNGAIAKDGKIPWNIKEDLSHFKSLTQGNVVIMGRKTYEAIGHALENRINVVLTSKKIDDNKIYTFKTLQEAIKQYSDKTIFICGGQKIYAEGIKYATKIYLTLVKKTVEGDRFFDLKILDNYKNKKCTYKSKEYEFWEYY